MTKLLIAGYFGYGNCGDEAILAGMLDDLRSAVPNCSFVIVSGRPQLTEAMFGEASIEWNDIPSLIEAIGACDLVLIGGGGLFQDYWLTDGRDVLTTSQAGLLSYVGVSLLAVMLGKPCMLYAVGFGPLRSDQGIKYARLAIELAACTTVRDRESLALIEVLDIPSKARSEIQVTADPAFGLPLENANKIERTLKDAGIDLDSPWCGACLRYWDIEVDQGTWETEVARALDQWLSENQGQVVFLPSQHSRGSIYEDDLQVSERVRGRMRNKNLTRVLTIENDPGLFAGVVSRSTIILAMRFHSALFSVAANVPAVALSYDSKVESLMKRAKLGRLVLPREGWKANLIFERLSQAPGIASSAGLSDFAAEMRILVRSNSLLARGVIGKGPQPVLGVTNDFMDFVLGKTVQVIDLQADVARQNDSLREKDLAIERVEDRHQEYVGFSQHVISELKQQLGSVVGERELLQREMADLRATFGLRLLGLYWALMKRMFPPGSRGRQIYHRLMHLLRESDFFAGSLFMQQHSSGMSSWAVRHSSGVGERHESESQVLLEEVRRFGSSLTSGGNASVTVVFAPTPLVQSEGQRSMQVALELSRRGHAVVFAYWRWDKGVTLSQDYSPEGILQIPLDVIVENPHEFFHSFSEGTRRVALFEFPYPGLFHALAVANGSGWITLYDVVDDWNAFAEVGQAPWYEEEFEQHLITATDAVLTVNDRLSRRVKKLGGNEAAIVPNGASIEIAEIDHTRPLGRGEITLGYIGHLSDAWFDWDLIFAVARARLSWRIYLVGYGQQELIRNLPPNIKWLGKMPQSHLAALAANWDVAMVPFKVGPVAASADPIKIYEYLAMGCQVVITGVFPPLGAETLVRRAQGVSDFIQQVSEAVSNNGGERISRLDFVMANTWERRVDRMLEIVSTNAQRVAEKRALFGLTL